MVAGNKRTRTVKRMQKVTPGNKTVTVYKSKKPSVARCQLTGQKLSGVPRLSQAKIKHLSRSARRPTRPFGGVLSPAAMKRVLIERVRN